MIRTFDRNMETHSTIESVPEEVWRLIFLKASEKKKFNLFTELSLSTVVAAREKMFKIFACVSSTFLIYIRRFVQVFFVDNWYHSNWLLSQFPSVTSLDLSLFNDKIMPTTLLSLTNLQSLRVYTSETSTIYTISQLTSLSSLSISHNRAIVDFVLTNLTNLTKLNVLYSNLVSENSIQKLSNLTSLSFGSANQYLTEKSIPYLTKLVKLRVLHSSIKEPGLIKQLTNLKSLLIWPSRKGALSNEEVGSLTQLTRLTLQTDFLTDDCLLHLTNLLHLNLSWNRSITNAGLRNLPQLTRLDLNSSVSIDHDGISHLTTLTDLNLRNIGLRIKNVGIERLTRLQRLIISRNDITSDALWNLTNLTHLELRMKEYDLNDEILKRLTKLCYLSILYHSSVTDDGLSHLVSLSSLTFFPSRLITDLSVCQLTNLTSLEFLNARAEENIRVNAREDNIRVNAKYLRNQENLVTDAGLKTLTQLVSLGIAGNRVVSDKSISLLTNLTSLSCNKYQISFACLMQLTKLRNLIRSTGDHI